MIRLTQECEEVLRFEAYPPPLQIDGARHDYLRKNRSENGWFTELARLENGKLNDFDLRQINVSRADAGRINAFHIHTKLEQNEYWTVIDGQLLVWLVDCRDYSPTVGTKRKFILSGEQPAQLYIPAGVAHGYRAFASSATLVYLVNQQFDLTDPNEGRLPWDFFGVDLWAEDRG